jgi:HK97 family phage prohead protease
MNTLLATIKSTSGTKDGSGSFEAILSVPTVDRDVEVVDAKAFDPLPDHITIDVDHAMTVEKTIGSGAPYYDGALLKFKGTYASTPLAQMVRTLVDEGHIRTMSVAYMNSLYEVDEKDGLRHLRKAELLNAGVVGIASNRDALITASKDFAAEIAEVTEPDLTLTKAGLCPACAAKTSPTGDESTTEEKAAEAADVKSPAEPARPSVVNNTVLVELLLAEASLA